ncbi:hypothetical protein [Caballeronia sordidicola]|uniref:hypothetical protein n=1 Tax=Caballeronia sordidicola TaxID=196367 RepID=UPI003F8D6BCA
MMDWISAVYNQMHMTTGAEQLRFANVRIAMQQQARHAFAPWRPEQPFELFECLSGAWIVILRSRNKHWIRVLSSSCACDLVAGNECESGTDFINTSPLLDIVGRRGLAVIDSVRLLRRSTRRIKARLLPKSRVR